MIVTVLAGAIGLFLIVFSGYFIKHRVRIATARANEGWRSRYTLHSPYRQLDLVIDSACGLVSGILLLGGALYALTTPGYFT